MLPADPSTVFAVAFSRGGKLLASAGGDGTVRLWNPTTRRPVGAPLDTAVGISADEHLLGKIWVRACPAQAEQLVAWARDWPERAWAVEGATGLGTCWPSSWSPPVSTWRMCRPSWPPGCGCWPPGHRQERPE